MHLTIRVTYHAKISFVITLELYSTPEITWFEPLHCLIFVCRPEEPFSLMSSLPPLG